MAIAVAPRLLADTLARALRLPDIEVVVVLGQPLLTGHFDAAIVMGSGAEHVGADVTVTLPTGGQIGSITTVSGTEPAALDDLDAVVDTLQRLLSDV